MQKVLLILILLIIPFCVNAQRPNPQAEKELLEYKIKYLSQEMDLKPNQQEKFVTLYTRMTNEKRKVYEQAIELSNKVKAGGGANSDEYSRATEAMNNAKIQEGKIDSKYDTEFRKFLTSKQIYTMKEAEAKFRSMLQELRQKKCGAKGGKNCR